MVVSRTTGGSPHNMASSFEILQIFRRQHTCTSIRLSRWRSSPIAQRGSGRGFFVYWLAPAALVAVLGHFLFVAEIGVANLFRWSLRLRSAPG
jgi:hypothetical protein